MGADNTRFPINKQPFFGVGSQICTNLPENVGFLNQLFAFLCARNALWYNHAMGLHFRIGSLILGCVVACGRWWQGKRHGQGHLFQTVEDANIGRTIPECYCTLQEEHASRVAVQCLSCHELLGQTGLPHVQREEGVAFGAQRCPPERPSSQHHCPGAASRAEYLAGSITSSRRCNISHCGSEGLAGYDSIRTRR